MQITPAPDIVERVFGFWRRYHAQSVRHGPVRMPPPTTPVQSFLLGSRLLLPMMLGVAPFGMIYGVVALKNGIAALPAMAMSSVLFAGSAQFLLAQMAGAGAPALVALGAIALVNARHALYSASLAPLLAGASRRWKLLLAYLLTDEAYAAVIGTLMREPRPPYAHWLLFGSGFTLWAGWQLSTLLGIVIGERMPDSLELDFALPLTFIAIVVPMVTTRAQVVAAVLAGGVALAGHHLPFRVGFMLATGVALAAALAIDRKVGA